MKLSQPKLCVDALHAQGQSEEELAAELAAAKAEEEARRAAEKADEEARAAAREARAAAAAAEKAEAEERRKNAIARAKAEEAKRTLAVRLISVTVQNRPPQLAAGRWLEEVGEFGRAPQ